MSRAGWLLFAAWACAAQWRLASRVTPPRELRGAAMAGSALLTWGVDTPTDGDYGPGGCAGDLDGDGDADLALLDRRASALVWLEAPSWRRRVIDTGADFDDCLVTDIAGRRGVLSIHLRAQVRFHAFGPGEGRWAYREIYSIYTPSEQGGLARADVDGDGRDDILAGNYWIQAPANAEESWRLFAINDWWPGPRSAMLRIALAAPGALIAAQREGEARVSRFARPANPKLFWTEMPVVAAPPWRTVGAIAAGPDGELFVAESAGPGSRVIEAGKGAIATTDGLFGLWLGEGELTGVGPREILRWRQRRK